MFAGLMFAAALAASPAPAVPAAISQDPLIDAAHPASGGGVQFLSHGSLINAQLYRPAGAGEHPTVILLHGLPGNEQNLDLARALQRAGWTVITFHYRGSWGSGGAFTLKGGAEDVEALLAELHKPERAKAWGVQANRIVLVGHSYGGMNAATVAARNPGILATVLIAPWDVSYDYRQFAKMTPEARAEAAAQGFDDVPGRLGPVTAASLFDDLMKNGADMDLTALAPALAPQRLLVLTATRDDDDDRALGLLPALRKAGAPQLTAEEMPTDHGFNDHRIALETRIVTWLANVPGAPALR